MSFLGQGFPGTGILSRHNEFPASVYVFALVTMFLRIRSFFLVHVGVWKFRGQEFFKRLMKSWQLAFVLSVPFIMMTCCCSSIMIGIGLDPSAVIVDQWLKVTGWSRL